jgi:hypothetical protein
VNKRYDVSLRAEPEFGDAMSNSDQLSVEFPLDRRSVWTSRWQCDLRGHPNAAVNGREIPSHVEEEDR